MQTSLILASETICFICRIVQIWLITAEKVAELLCLRVKINHNWLAFSKT